MSILGSALAAWLLFNLLIVTALYLKPLRALFRQWPGRGTLAFARPRRRTF
jgi:hypothetical protein